MPSGNYYRAQAQLFASLALATNDPQIAARYNEMALEQLARANEVDPDATTSGPEVIDSDDDGDVDRD